MKEEIEIPDSYEKYLDYIERNFGVEKDKYLSHIVKKEIKSRILDLNLH
jgi:hypothetical protein